MLLPFKRTIDGVVVDIIVDYDLIEIAPDYMVPKMCYLFFKPEVEIDEFESYFLSSALIERLMQIEGLGYFAGAKQNDDWVEMYYYTSDSKVLRHHLLSQLPENFGYEIGSNHDEKYTLFIKQLKPTASELLSIENRIVLDELLEEGDDLEAIHTFEHTFYFETKSQQDKAIKALEIAGHTIEETTIDDSLDARFVLITTHTAKATLEVVNDFTHTITQQMQKLSSYYDGWTTLLAGDEDEKN